MGLIPAINMDEVRAHALWTMGRAIPAANLSAYRGVRRSFQDPRYRPHYLNNPLFPHIKLPPDFSTETNFFQVGQGLYRVLSTAEARELSPRSSRPHRIFRWCDPCVRWVYAGKFVQHSKIHRSASVVALQAK